MGCDGNIQELLNKEALFSVKEAFLFIRFAGNLRYGIAGLADHIFQPVFIQRIFRQDYRLIFDVRRRNFFYRKGLSDCVIYMGLAHAALHAVYG